MNNDIKEILDKLNKLCYDDYCLEFSVDYIERKEEKLLLDYITNLQEENKRLKEENKMTDEQIEKTLEFVSEHIYKSRIDKAIEYINNHCLCEYKPDVDLGYDNYENIDNDLLNILQGSDKDE